MPNFTDRIKTAAYTELEVGALVLGAGAGAKFLSREKILPNSKPDSFVYKNFNLIKAGGAAVAATYITNPWIKLIVMGIALQGTVSFLRERWVDKATGEPMYPAIQAATEDLTTLDNKLKQAAENYHINATPEHSAVVGERLGGDTPEHSAVAEKLAGYNYALTNETSVAEMCGMDEF